MTAFASFESRRLLFSFLFGWGSVLLFSIFYLPYCFFPRLGVGLRIDYESDMEESDSRIFVMGLYFLWIKHIPFFLYTYCARMDNNSYADLVLKKTPSYVL